MFSSVTWCLLFIVPVLVFILVVFTKLRRRGRPGEPPVVAGNLLWGSAADFNRHAVNFLHKCRSVYGEVFTLRLVNQYITFIMDPHSVEAMCKERNFDFDPIQKQVNGNVFSFSVVEPKKMIKDAGRTVRGVYMQRGMHSFVQNLRLACDRIVPTSQVDKWSSDGLRNFAAKTVFDGLFNSIFGRQEATKIFSAQNVYDNFEVFHEYFNYLWLGVPKKFFPTAMKALGGLLAQPSADELRNSSDTCDYLKQAIDHMRKHGQSDSDIKGHNLVYLHVNYNTFRLAFWAINHVLEDPKALGALLKELQEAVNRKLTDNNTARFTLKELEDLKILDSVVNETCRLASGVFMIRYVNEDTHFKTSDGKVHLMRANDRVAIYPPAIHKDPEIFKDPLEFKYDRFIDATFYKAGRELKNPLLAFGTICPGKRYALLQLRWSILTIFNRFEMKLQDGEHAQYDYRCHGHEVLPPVSDVTIHYKPIPGHPVLDFSVA